MGAVAIDQGQRRRDIGKGSYLAEVVVYTYCRIQFVAGSILVAREDSVCVAELDKITDRSVEREFSGVKCCWRRRYTNWSWPMTCERWICYTAWPRPKEPRKAT